MGGDHRLSDTYADAAGAALRAAGHSADANHLPVVLPHVPHARGTEPADHVNGSVAHANGATDHPNGSAGHASTPAGQRAAGFRVRTEA